MSRAKSPLKTAMTGLTPECIPPTIRTFKVELGLRFRVCVRRVQGWDCGITATALFQAEKVVQEPQKPVDMPTCKDGEYPFKDEARAET